MRGQLPASDICAVSIILWTRMWCEAEVSMIVSSLFVHVLCKILCRNSAINVNNNSASGQPRILDLHGLHVGEAIPLLKREIAQLRFNSNRTRQREQVYICVGTGHHTKGSRTPSRLPAAVQRYLLEEEHLQYTEPQAGMLRIIIRWLTFLLSCSVTSTIRLAKESSRPWDLCQIWHTPRRSL